MFSRRFRLVTVLAAATGIPYVWFNENFARPLKDSWESIKARTNTSSGSPQGSWKWPLSIESSGSGVAGDAPNSYSQVTLHPLHEVLRFDITPRWVLDQWGRVSTVRAERDLQGLRVPLVTGTNFDDIAGSLTYYFDHQQRIRRITLTGQTGDERKLVAIAGNMFKLKPEPNLGAGMYVRRWNGTPMNVLRVSHAPIVNANDLSSRLQVELEVNDLSAGYGLSAEFQSMLDHDSNIHRWKL